MRVFHYLKAKSIYLSNKIDSIPIHSTAIDRINALFDTKYGWLFAVYSDGTLNDGECVAFVPHRSYSACSFYLASEKRPHKTCSNLRESAANLRMPSDNLSVAIWSSFSSQRKFASFNEIFSVVTFFASTGSNVRTMGSVLLPRSAKSLGLMVSKSQPANAVISPGKEKNK